MIELTDLNQGLVQPSQDPGSEFMWKEKGFDCEDYTKLQVSSPVAQPERSN